MTPKTSQGVYLERRRYRRRRIIEAVKVLPVLGIILFAMPLLWTDAGKTSNAMIYFFSVWLALVLAAVWLARRIAAAAVLKAQEPEE